jgi:hypothetical protein
MCLEERCLGGCPEILARAADATWTRLDSGLCRSGRCRPDGQQVGRSGEHHCSDQQIGKHLIVLVKISVLMDNGSNYSPCQFFVLDK